MLINQQENYCQMSINDLLCLINYAYVHIINTNNKLFVQFISYGVLSGVPDVIIHAKFYVNRLRGFLSGSIAKSAISYTYSNDPYISSAIPSRL